MEIKHGRIAMAAVTHVLLTVNGVRWPGYLSYAEDIKSQPGRMFVFSAGWKALPATLFRTSCAKLRIICSR